MCGALRVVPVEGETTWSFLHRVASAYQLEVADLTAWWRWVNPVRRRHGGRADGEVLLDGVAQEQLAGWCRVPARHLARALPSWASGPEALAGRGGQGQGWARWRVGALEWGPVVFGCRLCAARRGAGGARVWVYRPRWRRLCGHHGRWLLEAGEGHPLQFVDVVSLAGQLGRAQRRWCRVAGAAEAVGAAPREVFALARAVVCGWWQREEFWAREGVWGPRLEQVVAATSRQGVGPAGWGDAQWRLLARDVVVFPEVVAVAGALVDPRLQQLAAGGGPGLVRGGGGGERVAAALGERLCRVWLAEVGAGASGPLASWAQAVVRERQHPAGAPPRVGRYGLWWVHSAHQPVEVGHGLRLLADPSSAGVAGLADEAEGVVRRRLGQGRGLKQHQAQLFDRGLQQARAHVARHGHLAVAHADGPAAGGFDLGRWLANWRAQAAALTIEQAAQLQQLDAWWNPPWPIDWQRAWYRARTHVRDNGPVDGGDNLNGLPRWLERWLRQQISDYRHLNDGQRQLLAELGLTKGEVERFHAWPSRRRPMADGLHAARAYAARHGHLAVSKPTTADGFPLGAWLTAQRTRQRRTGRPTRLGRQLTALDAWWNPPWQVAWQRMWWACRYHLTGLPDGLEWWPGAPDDGAARRWHTAQHALYAQLPPGQQQLMNLLTALDGAATVPRVAAVSDAAWPAVRALLPALPGGHRWRDHRQVLDGILYIAQTRQPFTRLPALYGPWRTCHRRFQLWTQDGTLPRIAAARLPATDHTWQKALAQLLARQEGDRVQP